jgi:hypothetical protein
VLLLVARHPRLLAGAISFDAPVDLAERYRAFRSRRFGSLLQLLARVEIGGTPGADRRAYAVRSPLDVAGRIAAFGVPLQIWWSTRDRILADQREQSGALYRAILERNPEAPVVEVVGEWRHCAEYHWNRRLPAALRRFRLLPSPADNRPSWR